VSAMPGGEQGDHPITKMLVHGPTSSFHLIGAAGKWVCCLIKVKVKKAKSSTYVGKM